MLDQADLFLKRIAKAGEDGDQKIEPLETLFAGTFSA